LRQIEESERFARAWHMLMQGAVIAAFAGDRVAARTAQKAGCFEPVLDFFAQGRRAEAVDGCAVALV
jgi:hypothetical protein